MNCQSKRAPGFIYRANQVLGRVVVLPQHDVQGIDEPCFGQEECSPIYSIQDDVDEYFETIKDPEEEDVLARKPQLIQKQEHGFSLPSSPSSQQGPYWKLPESPKVQWAYSNKFEHKQKQKQRPMLKRSQAKSLNKKANKKQIAKTCKNPELYEETASYGLESPHILAPERQLAEPYFQYTYCEDAKKVLVEDEALLVGQVTQNKPQQTVNSNRVKQQEQVDVIRLLFENKSEEKQVTKHNQWDFVQSLQCLKVFAPFKLIDFMPQNILPSIQKLTNQLLTLKHLQNRLLLIGKKDKTCTKPVWTQSSISTTVISEMKRATQTIQAIEFYEGLDGIFASNRKVEQIKRFLVLERFSLTVITYVTVVDKFEEYKNYLLNLVRFLIENHLVLLSNIIVSKTLTHLISEYYPLLIKKPLDFIKVNNDSINEVILKLSVVDDLFFSSLNKLGKRTTAFPFGQIFKEFLEFLAFYVHKNSLHPKANTFSTALAPFLNLASSRYYLIIDATQFSIKEKKGNHSFRPFHQNFLKQMSQHYDIINYSYLDPKESKGLIQKFDRSNLIKHQLYSYHFDSWPQLRRCLTKICPEAKNLIYLNCEQNENNLERVISVRKWKGDKKDRELVDVCPILISIPYMKMDCQKVARAMQQCHSDIGKMQEALLPLLKKNVNQL